MTREALYLAQWKQSRRYIPSLIIGALLWQGTSKTRQEIFRLVQDACGVDLTDRFATREFRNKTAINIRFAELEKAGVIFEDVEGRWHLREDVRQIPEMRKLIPTFSWTHPAKWDSGVRDTASEVLRRQCALGTLGGKK